MAETPVGPGTLLAGRFSLDDLLDESGGARFWRATDRTLARSVAVHVLPDTDPRATSLLTAARTSALVGDGHLLRVLDAAAEDGVVYVVNEWGSGVSLDRLLSDGPLSPRRAAWVVKEVAEAITTAHRSGVAHGRLLPENVMISEAGSVKLVGFVIDAVLRTNAGRGQLRVTGGEPMSAHESDVVNLAGLLYACLVGRWPGSEGSTIPDAPTEHGRPMRPRQVRAGVPRPLDAICERVLNADAHPHMLPIETAHEIYAALSDYIGDPGAAAPLGVQVDDEATGLLDLADLPDAGHGSGRGSGHGFGPDDAYTGDGDTSDLAATDAFPAPAAAASDVLGPDQPRASRRGRPGGHPGRGADVLRRGQRRRLAARQRGPRAARAGLGPRGVPRWHRPHRPHRLGRQGRQGRPHRPGPSYPACAPARAARAAVVRRRPRRVGCRCRGGRRRRGRPLLPVPRLRHRLRHRLLHRRPAQHRRRQRPAADGLGARPGPGPRRARRPPRRAAARPLLAAARGRDRGGARRRGGHRLRVQPRPRLRHRDSTPARGSSTSPSASATASTRLAISEVSDFDPEGDPPEENPDLTRLAVDGKPGTAWETLTYRGNPKLGGLKSGVGLRLDLGKATRVGQVRLTLLGSPTSVQILAAPGADTAPTSTDGLRTVASDDGAGTEATLTLKKPVTTRWLVVWLTSLPAVPGGYQGRVAEITVRS